MADADVRVEWLEAQASGPGSFKPLTARNVRVSVALTDAGAPVLVLGLKPKELELPLVRLRVFAGMAASHGKLTLRLEPEPRPRGARGAQVMLSGGNPEALAALARAAEAAARGETATSHAPLAQLNGVKRPLGISPGKPAQPSRRGEGDGAAPEPQPAQPLSSAQQRAVDLVASRRNVFITGAAGTGKSHVLRAALQHAPCARGATFLTAPTGLAAAELGPGGMTLNAFAGIGRAEGTVDQLIARVKSSRAAVARWRSCSRLVVDEVSMLDAALMDALDEVARAVRGRDSACFGGIQLVLCGDFFQLPPVRRGEEDADAESSTAHCYAFGSRAWDEAKLATVELTEPFRQSDDPAFFRLLNSIRIGRLDAAAEATLRRCEATPAAAPQAEGAPPAIVPTRLHTHRADVERENVLALAELPGEPEIFAAEDSGGCGAGDASSRLASAGCRARATLRLKVGAQVMLLRAVAPRAGLVNGARGVVTSFTNDSAQRLPVVRFACGVTTAVCRVRFSAAGCERLQLPLELAWALSVHKAQGMSLDAVEVSLARAFEAGQAYVALSRARSLSGLRVARGGVTRDAVRAHPAVLAFYDRLRGDGDAAAEEQKPRKGATSAVSMR